jgi:hypothetical protein
MDDAEKACNLSCSNDSNPRLPEVANGPEPDTIELQKTRTDRLAPTIEIQRTHSSLLQYQMTVGSQASPSTQCRLPSDKHLSMGMGRAIPANLPDPHEYLVDFDGPLDPLHPFNWKFSTKYVFAWSPKTRE